MDEPTPSIEILASTIEVPVPRTAVEKTTKQKDRQCNFSVLEDQELCKAWVSVAEAPITGSNQSFKGYWIRITTLFLKQSKTIRSKDSLIGRFRHITKRVNLFIGYMEAAEDACISGATHETKMTMARLTYTGDQDEGFKLDHCYEILRHCQKWYAYAATKVKKTPSNIIDLSEDGSPAPPVEPDRLDGVKTSKEKKKRTLDMAKATDDFFVRLDERFVLESTLHESNLGMREKELQLRLREVEAKEQRNKQKQRKEDARILALDLSVYNEETRIELEEQQKESNVFQQVIHGDAPRCDFTVNEHTYKLGYYLADGIYPSYATLVKTIRQPQTGKERNFAKGQEAARKDVERGFGVLQSRWHILKHSAHSHKLVFLGKIVKTCIIMHNMIVENEGEENVLKWRPESNAPIPTLFKDLHFQQKVFQMIQGRQELRGKGVHIQLQQDLVEHLWKFDAENSEPQEAPPIYEDSTDEDDVQEEDFDNVANFID